MANLPDLAPVKPSDITDGQFITQQHVEGVWDEVIAISEMLGGTTYVDPFNDADPASSNIVDSVNAVDYDLSNLQTTLSAIVSRLKATIGTATWYDDPTQTLESVIASVAALSITKTTVTTGLDADKPSAGSKSIGFLYLATDTKKLYAVLDEGSGNTWVSLIAFRTDTLTNKSLYYYDSASEKFLAVPPPTLADTYFRYDGTTFGWSQQGVTSALLNSPCRYIPANNEYQFYATIQAAIDATDSDEVVIVPPGTYEGDLYLKEGTTLVQNIPESVTIKGLMKIEANCRVDIHKLIISMLDSYPNTSYSDGNAVGLLLSGFTAGKLDSTIRISEIETDWYNPANADSPIICLFTLASSAATGSNLPTINILSRKMEIVGDGNFYTQFFISNGGTGPFINFNCNLITYKSQKFVGLTYSGFDTTTAGFNITCDTFNINPGVTSPVNEQIIMTYNSANAKITLSADNINMAGIMFTGFRYCTIICGYFSFTGTFNTGGDQTMFTSCKVYGENYYVEARRTGTSSIRYISFKSFVSVSEFRIKQFNDGFNYFSNTEIDIERIYITDDASHTSEPDIPNVLLAYGAGGVGSYYRVSNTVIDDSASIITAIVSAYYALRINNVVMNTAKVYDGGAYITYDYIAIGLSIGDKIYFARTFV